MKIDTVKLVFFSPTRTTATIVEAIAQGTQIGVVERIDLTAPDAAASQYDEMGNDLAVIGAPVYCGRIPPAALSRLRRIKANATPAVVVAVYGNREYEDALRELRDVCAELGFRPIAGGAFIGEHSLSCQRTPIAAGRPDKADLDEAKRFGRLVKTKVTAAADCLAPVEVPGGFPYTEERLFHCNSDVSPVTTETLCNLCGTCSSVCPTNAIVVADSVLTDRDECILCSACVKNCPTGARTWEADLVTEAAEFLSTNFGSRKEPEIYL
jgi:ferredoxin